MGLFLLLNEKDEIIRIKRNHRVAGHFAASQLKRTLQDKATKRMIQTNICLLHSIRHACELSYVNKKWYFYNPNRSKEKPNHLLILRIW